ncbi:MAG: beta-lactamase family protein [Anaerolineales bacterium]|nr:beta-lactamase family protein [Anaerolineales bacterium]
METKRNLRARMPSAALWMALALAGILLLAGCGPAPVKFDADRATAELDALLESSVRDGSGIVNRHTVLYIEAPAVPFTYSGAAGIARVDSGEPMTADRPFFIASVAKAMTATVIHQLAEEGAFGPKGIDATLPDLDVLPADVLPELHKQNGKSYAHEITLRHLLNQTAGLRDLFFDDPVAPVSLMPGTAEGAAPDSLIGVLAFDSQFGLAPLVRCTLENIPAGCNPDDYLFRRRWSAWNEAAWRNDPADRMAGLLNFYLAGMNEHALWMPGKGFHYSDTNYLLLGLVIERKTGRSLAEALRERIFDPAGMRDTYLIGDPAHPDGDDAGKIADVWAWNEPAMSGGVDFSFDWGGGGVISTIADLRMFLGRLKDGDLFQKPETLNRMLEVPQGIQGLYYASGMIVFPTADGPVWYMMGSNGTWAEYFPAQDLFAIGTTDDLSDMPKQFMLHMDAFQILAACGLPTPMAATANPAMLGLAVCILLLLVLPVIWLARALWRRFGKSSGVATNKPIHILVGALWLANLLTLVITGIVFGENIFQMLFGFSPDVRLVLGAAAVLMAILALGMGSAAVLLWRQKEESHGDRWLAAVLFIITLSYVLSLAMLL